MSILQLIAFLVLMVVVFHYRKRTGALWVTLVLEDFIAIVLVRRIDEIGAFFGIDVISPEMNSILTWLVFVIVPSCFWRSAIQRQRVEQDPRVLALEQMRTESETRTRSHWDHQAR
jgi:preprotein translocase subunit YajC